MNLHQEAPKLPLLPFLVADGVLIAAAVFIGRTCAAPIGPWPLLAITVCVVFGAVLSAIPFVVNYAKRQDAELTERQNQIAALARTTSESAEQLSIAAASLHGIAQASSGNLKLIEDLPAQLQDHVKGLQKQLTDTAKSAAASAKEESTRIDAASERIAQAVADLSKLETATRQHLESVNEALSKFSARPENAGPQINDATAAIIETKTKALADLESQLDAATRAISAAASGNLKLIEQLPGQLDNHVKTLGQQSADMIAAASKAGHQINEAVSAALAEAKTHALADFELQLTAAVTRAFAQTEHTAPTEAPRRKRTKHAHEEPPVTEETLSAETPAEAPPVEPPPAPRPVVEESVPSSPPPDAVQETPVVVESPVEPPTSPAASPATEETLSTPADPSPDEVPVDAPPKPRIPRQPKPAPDPGFDLGLSVDAPESESAITSDGFTRLIATAYIGIGNKLFIRGEGPGLSWEKGVPLQFVSIGKWRWETPDATAPISAKLYKNDQTECTSVGTLTMEPGHQHEVNAGF